MHAHLNLQLLLTNYAKLCTVWLLHSTFDYLQKTDRLYIKQCLPGSKVLSHGDSDILTVLQLQPTHLQINEGYKKVCIYTTGNIKNI